MSKNFYFIYSRARGIMYRVLFYRVDCARVIDYLDRHANLILAIATAALVWIAFGQWIALDNTDQTLRRTLIEANRAWVGPDKMLIDFSSWVNGEPVYFGVFVKNFGKGPAINTVWNVDSDEVEAPGSDLKHKTIATVDMCNGVVPDENGPIIFPDTGNNSGMKSFSSGTTAHKIVIDDGLRTFKKLFVARGCIVYHTLNIMGKVNFCLVNTIQTNKAGEVVSQHTNICNEYSQ